MNIEDALLTKKILEALKGTAGKSYGCLANECHTSQRRMTYFLLCLEKAGLVMIHANKKVYLADDLARIAWHHALYLEERIGKTFNPAIDDYFGQIAASARVRFSESKKFHDEFFTPLFNEFFGSPRGAK